LRAKLGHQLIAQRIQRRWARVWAGANSVARSSALGRRKAFFFEKKKQKTFIYRGQHLIGPFGPPGGSN
jgi:hypothetical protein